MSLLPVADAQARLLALIEPLPAETAPLTAAAGRWAAEEIVARRTQPEADLSAMDGYALRFAELPGPYHVVGEAAAGGAPLPPLGRGEAARIFTGAALPPGADTILIQEDARQAEGQLTRAGAGPPHRGAHVRLRGSDFRTGERLIAAGALLTPARIALAAIGGHDLLPVHRRPRVALLSTGDELVVPGTAGGLPASNAPMLAALLGTTPALVGDHGIVADDLVSLTAALTTAARDADLLVTTGGASVGDHDLVRPALERAGAELDFWRVAMKPGKPLMAGRIGGTIVLGLPGNPVSAFVTALLFLLPAVRRLAGAADPLPVPILAVLAQALPPGGLRAEYLRATLDRDGLRLASDQGSAAMRALADATHLIVRQPHAAAASIGDVAEMLAIA